MPLARPAEGAPDRASLPYLVLGGAVAAAYANALGGSFQFDDWNVIVDEPRVRSLAAWWESMPGIRPLLKLTYACNHSLSTGPIGFHAVNLLVHVAGSSLAFALLLRLALREGIASRSARGVALLGALVFALHPVQTEAVTYLSGRSASLSALFCLASLVSWIDGRAQNRSWLIALSAACFAAALLVKETAMALPLAILLFERGNVTRKPGPRPRLPVVHFAILGLAALAILASPVYRHLLATSLDTRSIGTNLVTQANGVAYLAGQLVRFDRLNADPALPVLEAWTLPAALAAAAILAVLALSLALLRRRYAFAFGILWFFLWLAPTNSLLPRLDVANDRQLYLALLGPAWIAAWYAGKALAGRRALIRFAALLTVGVVLVAAGLATHRRNRVYADEIVFWQDVAQKSPENGRAFNNLGYAFALASRNEEAETAFRRALALDPADTRAAVNLRLLRAGALLGRPRRAP